MGTGAGSPLVALARSLGVRLERVFRATLPAPSAGLLAGLVLGDRAGLERDLAQDFQRTGLAHVLSVSGLHVGFVAGALLGALRPLRLGPRGRAAVVVPALGLYALLTGAGAPVLRASVMLAAGLLGRCLGRPGLGGHALTLAFLALVAARPSWLFDPGFQLSFAATLGIFQIGPCLRTALATRVPGLPAWVAEGLAVSLAAQGATLPLILHYFGTLSLVAPVANLVAVPLAGVAVPLGFAGGVVGLAAPGAAWMINRFTGLVLEVMRTAVHWLAGWPGAALFLPRPSSWAVVLVYAAAACVWRAAAVRQTGPHGGAAVARVAPGNGAGPVGRAGSPRTDPRRRLVGWPGARAGR